MKEGGLVLTFICEGLDESRLGFSLFKCHSPVTNQNKGEMTPLGYTHKFRYRRYLGGGRSPRCVDYGLSPQNQRRRNPDRQLL